MDLPSLSYRRLLGDAIEAYKFVHGRYSVDWSSLLPLAAETSTVVTRGHTFKLKKRDGKTSVRLNFFSYRIVNVWNSMPESVVSAPSVGLNCFKHRFDEHCIDLMFATTRGVRNVINCCPDTRINFERVPGYPLKIHNSTITAIESCRRPSCD